MLFKKHDIPILQVTTAQAEANQTEEVEERKPVVAILRVRDNWREVILSHLTVRHKASIVMHLLRRTIQKIRITTMTSKMVEVVSKNGTKTPARATISTLLGVVGEVELHVVGDKEAVAELVTNSK